MIVKRLHGVCWVGLSAKDGVSIKDPMFGTGPSLWVVYSREEGEARRQAERVADFCGLPFEPDLD